MKLLFFLSVERYVLYPPILNLESSLRSADEIFSWCKDMAKEKGYDSNNIFSYCPSRPDRFKVKAKKWKNLFYDQIEQDIENYDAVIPVPFFGQASNLLDEEVTFFRSKGLMIFKFSDVFADQKDAFNLARKNILESNAIKGRSENRQITDRGGRSR